MDKKNVKDDILKKLVSLDVPLLTFSELMNGLTYEDSSVNFAIIELEKNNHIAIIKPRFKGDVLRYSLTQDGEIFIKNTSYYKEHWKEIRKNFFNVSDKIITLLGILTGIIFGINSCSTEAKNERLINLVEKKDSIIVNYNKEKNNLDIKFDSLKKQVLQIRNENKILIDEIKARDLQTKNRKKTKSTKKK